VHGRTTVPDRLHLLRLEHLRSARLTKNLMPTVFKVLVGYGLTSGHRFHITPWDRVYLLRHRIFLG
jgi:hypothetical protein